MPQRASTQPRIAGLGTPSELHKDRIPCLRCESCFSRIQSCPLWSSFPVAYISKLFLGKLQVLNVLNYPFNYWYINSCGAVVDFGVRR